MSKRSYCPMYTLFFRWVRLLVDPVVQALLIPRDFDGIKLHAHREYHIILVAIVRLRVAPEHRAKIEVLNLLFVCVDELAPFLLALLALHLILVYRSGQIELRKFVFEMLVDVVVEFGQAQLRARDFLEYIPVCFHVLDDFDGKLLLDLGNC